jgi:hypothetical protein
MQVRLSSTTLFLVGFAAPTVAGPDTPTPPPGGYFVSGYVNKPNGFSYSKNLTLVKAIARAGGFKTNADKKRVRLLRGAFYDQPKALETFVNVEDIRRGRSKDVAVKPGDWIKVDKRPAGWNVGRLFPPRSFRRGIERFFNDYKEELAIAIVAVVTAREVQRRRSRGTKPKAAASQNPARRATARTSEASSNTPLPPTGGPCGACTGFGGIFCFICRGTGTQDYESFGGSRTIGQDTPRDRFWRPRRPCGNCSGLGKVTCGMCGGSGRQK